MVSKGDFIFAIDENKRLEVEGLWPAGVFQIDFQAKYVDSNLVDSSGHRVFGNRGFRFKDEGVKWRKI